MAAPAAPPGGYTYANSGSATVWATAAGRSTSGRSTARGVMPARPAASPSRTPLHELGDDPAAVDDRHRTAERREVRLRRVHAQEVEDRAQDVLHAGGVGGGVHALAVGGADDSSRPRSAAREDHALRLGPVVAPGPGVDAGGTA